MVRYTETAIVAKVGINFVRTLTERNGSVFHKVEQENDLGVDCIIEIVVSGQPTGRQIAAQIKSGESYYDSRSKTCSLPIGFHRDYWARHPLPIIGIVVVPSLDCAYWIDIKAALRAQAVGTKLKFSATRANVISEDTFATRFLPLLRGVVPEIPLEEAISLATSALYEEVALGVRVLFNKYPNELGTWDVLLNHVLDGPAESVKPIWIYYLAHIPWPGISPISANRSPNLRGNTSGRSSRL